MATPRGALSILGIPDPRDKTKRDLVNMYSDYILTGGKPATRQFGPPAGAASSEPGWGEPSEVSDEEEISQDKGQIVEFDNEEEDKTPPVAAEEEAAIAEDAGDESVDAAGALPAAGSARNAYEEQIIKELEAARAELLKQKKLGIADILGAGNIRKSAQLIRETEALNEQRQMKARDLALDILMRKSAGEEKRQAAERLEKYRQGLLDVRRAAAEKGPQDPSQVRADRIAAKAMFPNLPEDQAYAKYLREVKYRPPASRAPTERYDTAMARLQAKEEAGEPLTRAEKIELANYKKRLEKGDAIDRAIAERLGL